MDIPQLTQLITALATFLGVVYSIIVSLRNRKTVTDTQSAVQQTQSAVQDTQAALHENTGLTKEVHAATNGKMDEVVRIVNAAAEAAQAAAAAAQAHLTRQDVQAAQPAVILVQQPAQGSSTAPFVPPKT
jgi:anti-sigma factor ChrR (cupin superfamily)